MSNQEYEYFKVSRKATHIYAVGKLNWLSVLYLV